MSLTPSHCGLEDYTGAERNEFALKVTIEYPIPGTSLPEVGDVVMVAEDRGRVVPERRREARLNKTSRRAPLNQLVPPFCYGVVV